MKTFLFSVMVSLLLSSAIIGAQQLSGTVLPVATIRQLHDAMITPASDALFTAEQDPPANDDQWLTLRNNALVLAESGNLLMLGNRARDKGAWMKMSRGMVDAAVLALRAVETRNIAALGDANGRIVAVCETCHDPYRDHGRGFMKR